MAALFECDFGDFEVIAVSDFLVFKGKDRVV
jgi:hypothetical protein